MARQIEHHITVNDMRFITSNRGLVHINQLFKIIITKHLLSHHSWHTGADSLYWNCKGLNVKAYIMFSKSNLTFFIKTGKTFWIGKFDTFCNTDIACAG